MICKLIAAWVKLRRGEKIASTQEQMLESIDSDGKQASGENHSRPEDNSIPPDPPRYVLRYLYRGKGHPPENT